MAGDYVEVQPDSTGKKVEARAGLSDTDIVYRQVVELGDNRAIAIAELLIMLLREQRETRRVLCQIAGSNFEEPGE